jgi:hypothetical protein
MTQDNNECCKTENLKLKREVDLLKEEMVHIKEETETLKKRLQFFENYIQRVFYRTNLKLFMGRNYEKDFMDTESENGTDILYK